ncbi:MAG: CARDB domain-containing protein [Candidatus Poseidoniales archaeon]
MSNKSMSKMDMRSAIVAFSVVAMLVVSFGVSNVDAAASPVSLTSDISSADIMKGDYVIATITVSSSDNTYRKMEVKLTANFPSGISWGTMFLDTDENPISGDMVSLGKQDSTTVKLAIFCDGVCEAGDTNTVQVYGQTDPRWYDGGADGDNCGSTDCETDTSPASSSSNVTNTLSISLTARTGGSHTVVCDAASSEGTNQMFHGSTYQWGYDLTNTGWNTDTYTFAISVNTKAGATVSDWTANAGLSTKELTGQSDTSSSAVHAAEASMSLKISDTARPGVYTIGLLVTGTNSGNVEGCTFDVVVPEPDLEVLDTDISFSHSSAWINSRGDSQRVTIYAKIRNNGGTMDSEGVPVTDVDVIFLVDGSQLGSVQTISSLDYQEEVTLQAFWNPGRAHDSNEVGIPIKVSVDPSVSVQESDADNNIGSTHFKVVKTKASNPSFYMSFLSLVGAVGAAVLMSTYYRNKDLEE